MAVAVVVAIGLFIWGIDREFRDQKPPDVAKIAHSASVQSADHDATDELTARVAALARDQTWLVPGPTAVRDQCQSLANGTFKKVWLPVTCNRVVTAYYSFNGDFVQRMQTWEKALDAAGWSPEVMSGPLDEPLAYYKKYAHQPESQASDHIFLADDLPASGQLCHRGTGHRSVCLSFRWAERPRTTVPSSEYQGPNVDAAAIQEQTVDPAALESAAYAHEQYLAIVTLSDTYYDAATPPPAPTPLTTYTPCYSGSGNCD